MMNNINQILITGDIFRPNKFGDAGQDININWFYEALRNPLKLATNLNISKQLFSKLPESLTQHAYRMIDEETSTQAWAKLFRYQDFSDDFLQHVWIVFRKSLVVAFEIPEILRAAFETLNICYVDIIVHPIRFLDDVIFGVRSNNEEIYKQLIKHKVSEESILTSAGIVMASMSRLKRLNISGRVALFAGQTTDDKVLIKDGKFIKLTEFYDRFAQIIEEFDTLLIKPHPYSRDPFNAIAVARIFDKCVVVNENFYYLMSHENIEAVYSISSSTSIEARALGRQGYHFADYPFHFTDAWCDLEFKKGAFIAMDDIIFTSDFWKNILKPIIPTTELSGFRFPKKPNRIRMSLRSFWGFNFVDTDLICELYKR